MDIDILLALQEFRFLIHDALTPFMEMISLFFLIETLSQPLRALLGLHWGTLATEFIIYFFIIVIWPAVMKRAVINKENTEENDMMEDLK